MKRKPPKLGDVKKIKCGCCGKKRVCIYENNPYDEDVNEVENPEWLCDDCHRASVDDI